MEELSLSIEFQAAEARAHALYLGESMSDEIIIELIRKFENCEILINTQNLFSKNEELDDFSTISLQYLAIHYYIAKTSIQIKNLLVRKKYLESAEQYYTGFLKLCEGFKLFKDETFSYTPSVSHSYALMLYIGISHLILSV